MRFRGEKLSARARRARKESRKRGLSTDLKKREFCRKGVKGTATSRASIRAWEGSAFSRKEGVLYEKKKDIDNVHRRLNQGGKLA